jgi:hypothetical protein
MVSDLDFLDSHHKYPPLGEFDNQKAIRLLKREQKDITVSCIFFLFGMITSGLVLPPVALGLTLGFKRELKKLEKISNIINVMETLLSEFQEENMEIIPRVQVPKEETGLQFIDLFIRMPVRRVYFVLCVRKYEQIKIVFNEEKDKLMKRRKKGLKPIDPDPLQCLASSTTWVQKNKVSLFGRVSNDKRRPCAKLLVLVGSTKIGKHREELYSTFGEEKFLAPKLNRPIIIVHYDHNLCSFIKNFIEEKGKSLSSSLSQPQATSKQGKSKSSIVKGKSR